MEEKFTWNLKEIFEKEEDFYKAKQQIYEKLDLIEKYKGTLENSSNQIYEVYNIYEKTL